MGSIADFLENELLDHVCNAAYTPAATVYLGLSTADPTDDASGLAEPSGNGYIRKAITLGAAASRVVTQSGNVTFDQASGAWGTITHWGIFDAESAGNMLAHGALAASKVVISGNTPSVATTEVTVSYNSGYISDYLANKLLDFAFRNQAYSVPDTYCALTTAVISDGDTGITIIPNEPSGGSYARKEVDVNGGASPTWDAASGGALDNTHDVDFAAATGSWGTIVALGIVSASASGELLFYDNAVADQAVGNGDTVRFGSGELDISMS